MSAPCQHSKTLRPPPWVALDTEWVVRALELGLGQMRVERPGRCRACFFRKRDKAGLKEGLKTLALCLLDKWRVLGGGEPRAGNEKGARWAEG